MKKLMVVLASALTAALTWAKGVEQVSVVENEIATISVPFGITSYMPSNKDVVRIEELSGTTLRITALRRGRCDLEVRGDNDLSQKYEITVLGDLATMLDTLTSELDQVQEVRARIVGDYIRIDGEISSITKWEYLQKVLRDYGTVVHNFAVFAPGPDVMLRMKETIEEAGFAVVFQSLGKDRKAWPANTVALVLNKQTQILTVQGRVFTPAQKAKIVESLSTERWLTMDLKPTEDTKNGEEFRIRGRLDVVVDRPQIRISLAYMAIGDEDVKHLGNPNAYQGAGVLGLDGLAQTLMGVVKDRGQSTKFNSHNAASIGATLDVTSRFLKKNGITRVSETGYTVMESWDKDGANFKSGGTRYVTVSGLNAGSLQSIDYGFILKTLGGLTEDGANLDATIDIEISSIDGTEESGNGQVQINKSEQKSSQRLRLPLGRTTFLSGKKLIDETRLSPSGLPILRSTPILNWFVADSGTELNDKRLVIMVCPEVIDPSQEGTIDVENEINIPVPTEGVKTTEQREAEKRPFKGGLWNPLNWFVF